LKKGEVAQKNFKEEIPFETRAGLIVIKATVNNKEYHFIYDTGATNCVTKEVAEELKLKPVIDQTAVDAEGKKGGIQFAMLDEIRLGKISFANTAAAIIDLKAVPELACLGVDGLIGANLMRKACWQIDYVKQTLVFSDDLKSLIVPSNAFSFEFSSLISGTPVVEVEVTGEKSKDNVFDTGSSGEITLSAPTLKNILKKDKSFKFLRGIGSSSAGLYGKGNDTNYIARTENVKMGALTLTNHVVEFKRDKGNLGSGFFKDYVVTMDWNQKKIWFVPQPDTKQKWETFGFGLTKADKKLLVSYLIENSPASLAGIKTGDEVISVNEKDYREISDNDYCDMMVRQSPWKKEKKVQLVIRSAEGNTRTIELEKKNLFETN
jgi:predicted aspartyl protease